MSLRRRFGFNFGDGDAWAFSGDGGLMKNQIGWIDFPIDLHIRGVVDRFHVC